MPEQPSLFDRGDAEAVSEKAAKNTKCAFCDVIANTATALIIDENDRSISLLDHRPLFSRPHATRA
jgi:hypothetical protein